MRKPVLALALWAFGTCSMEAVQAQQLSASLVPGQRDPARAAQVVARPAAPVQPVPLARIGSWSTLASMSQARGQHAAAVVGSRIYVWGGYVGPATGTLTEFNSLQVYNVATGTWSAGANYPIQVRGQAYAVGNDGLIYSFGGASGAVTNGSYRYNPATNTWSALATMPTGMWQASAATGADGRIYVFGGFNGTPAEALTQIYNPATNTWASGANMPLGRHGHATVRDANGLMHVIGGTNSNAEGSTAITSHLSYNPTTNAWTTLAALPVGLNQAGAVLGADGNIYVVGGKASYVNNTGPFFNTVYIYNPGTDSWSQGTDIPQTLAETRAVTVGTDVYALAGTDGVHRAVAYRAAVSNSYTWTGAVSTAWTLANNWSERMVPTAVDDVTIPAGLARYPVVSTATATARTVTVNSGATLTVNDGGTLSLTGNFENNGTFAANGNATVSLTGGAVQAVGGSSTTQFRNLTVGASGASLTGRTEIQRLLTLTGNLATNGQQFLILSNNVGSGMVHNNGGAVTGSAMVQRYIDPAGNPGFGYRHFAPAVSGATLNNLAIFPILTGAPSAGPIQINAAYNTAAQPSLVTPFPTVFAYDESRVVAPTTGVASFDRGWLSPTTNQALVVGQGLTINQPAGNFFELTGTALNNGPFTRNNLARGARPESGWHLVGNPYPSPLDWSLVGRTNIDGAAYVYRSTGRYTGGYTSFVNGVPNASILPMGQAFFVRVSSGSSSGSLSFTNAARVTTFTEVTYARPTAETRPLLQLTLQRQGSRDAASQDDLYVYKQAGATVAFDAAFDALKVQLNGGQQPSLYLLAGPDALAIQGLAEGAQPVSLPLGLYAPTAGTYEFAPAQLLNFPASDQLWLEDKLAGTWHNLRQGTYPAQLGQGASTTRFVLHLNVSRPLATAKAAWAGEVQVYPNPTANTPLTVTAAGLRGASAQVRLISALGQVVRQEAVRVSGHEARLTLPVTGLAAGVYTLQVTSEAGTITRKVFFQ